MMQMSQWHRRMPAHKPAGFAGCWKGELKDNIMQEQTRDKNGRDQRRDQNGEVRITKKEYEQLAAFRYALRSFLRFSERAAEAYHVTAQQYQALLAIKGFRQHERLTMGELADQLQVRSHSAVELVDRMVVQGLVRREPSADDRRQVCVVLTPPGDEILAHLAAVHKEQLHIMAPELKRLIAQLLGSSESDEGESDQSP